MKHKIAQKNLTLLTSILAYFANAFMVNLPFVLVDKPYQELSNSPLSFFEANSLLVVFQHLGILTGTIFFSLWADRKGRLFILFVSVFLYSFGTLLGGLVDNYHLFLLLRFLVGFGLAPELGIGLVLVCELFTKEKRSLNAMLIAMAGFFAIFLLSILSSYFSWRELYISAGIGGLLVMLARFGTFESDLFLKIKREKTNPSMLKKALKNPSFFYLLLCVLPIYLLTASSTYTAAVFHEKFSINYDKKLIPQYYAIGAMLGFVLFPYLGSWLKSRKRVFQLCIFGLLFLAAASSFTEELHLSSFFVKNNYLLIVATFGLFSGYLFEFFIFSIEQFGTNIRGGATTLLFGLGRSSVFVFSLAIPFFYERVFKNYSTTVFVIEFIVFMMAFWASTKLTENYNRDLDFLD